MQAASQPPPLLSEFRREAQFPTLSGAEQTLIVEQALLLIESNYAHLPHKRAMYAVDPVQRLRLLRQRVESPVMPPLATDVFHAEMLDIFCTLHDRHTRYRLPEPFASKSAYLPFMVEDCVVDGRTVFLVSHIAQDYDSETFGPGAEVEYWNGAPVNLAVERLARCDVGANRDARFSRAVQQLTNRPLKYGFPPEEDWVDVGYWYMGSRYERRFAWRVAANPPAFPEPPATPLAACAIDWEQDAILRVRQVLYGPGLGGPLVGATTGTDGLKAGAAAGTAEVDIMSKFPAVFEARRIPDPDGPFGYIRIRNFNLLPGDAVPEFIKLLGDLNAVGLVIDIRANQGGQIPSAEGILKTLREADIECEPGQFLNSALNLQICRDNFTGSFQPWVESIRVAPMTGATLSAGFPISDPKVCNETGQVFKGPVVLIVDALSYSAADVFAAGFQDHGIGTILGTDTTTGAGGGNSVNQSDLLKFVLKDTPYKGLPAEVGMSVSLQRTLRIGRNAGVPIEDIGVHADEPYSMTPRDLLHRNADLIDRAVELLKSALLASKEPLK